MFEIVVNDDTNQNPLYLDNYILSVFLPNIRAHQRNILFTCIINKLTANSEFLFNNACAALTKFCDYLSLEDRKKLLNKVLQLVLERYENIYNYGFNFLKFLLTKLHIEQINTELLEQLLAQTKNDLIPEKVRQLFLGVLVDYLPANEIKKLLIPATEFRKAEDNAIRLVGYQILHAAVSQLQKDEVREVLTEIQVFFAKEYEKWNVKNPRKPKPPEIEIIIKIFSILCKLLPELSQEQLIATLPPIEALWNDNVNDARAITLGKFIREAISKIDYASISEELFLDKPLLFIMKLMHLYTDTTISNQRDSTVNYGAPQFFFSRKESIEGKPFSSTNARGI